MEIRAVERNWIVQLRQKKTRLDGKKYVSSVTG